MQPVSSAGPPRVRVVCHKFQGWLTFIGVAVLTLLVLSGLRYYPAANAAVNVLLVLLAVISLTRAQPTQRVLVFLSITAYWCIQAVIANVPPEYLFVVGKAVLMLWIGADAFSRFTRRQLFWLAVTVALALTMSVGALVAQLFGGLVVEQRDVGQYVTSRPGGLFINPNLFASAACAGLALLGYLTARANAAPSAIYVYAFAAVSVGIAISLSRAGILFLALGVSLVAWEVLASRKHILPAATIMLSLMLAACIAVWWLAHSAVGGEAAELWQVATERFQGDGSSRDRQSVLEFSIQLWAEHPVLGGGFNEVQKLSGIGSHNQVLHALANYGLLGGFGLAIYYLAVRTAEWRFLFAAVGSGFLFSHNLFEMYPEHLVTGALVGLASVETVSEKCRAY
jgi:O-antigen ligase